MNLKNIKIGKKVIVSFSVFFLLFFVFGLVIFNFRAKLKKQYDNYEKILDVDHTIIKLVNSISTDFFINDEKFADSISNDYDKYNKILNNIDVNEIGDTQQKTIFNNIKQKVKYYNIELKKYISYLKSDKQLQSEMIEYARWALGSADKNDKIYGKYYGGATLNKRYDIVNSILNIRRHEKNYSLKKDDIYLEYINREINNIKSAKPKPSNNIIINVNKYKVSLDKFVANTRDITKSKQNLNKIFHEYNYNIRELEKLKNISLNNMFTKAGYLVSFFLIIFIGFSILIIYILFYNIISPVKKLVEKMEKIADGDLSQDITVKSTNEIGHLYLSLHHIQENFKTSNKNLLEKIDYLNKIPTPVEIIDKDFNVKFINEAGADFVNKTPDECIGKKCYHLFNTEHCRTKNCIVEKAISTDNIFTADNITNINNKITHMRYTGAPLKNASGEIYGAIEYFIDITNENKIIELTDKIIKGDYSGEIQSRFENDRLSSVLNKMSASLLKNAKENKQHQWLMTGFNDLNEIMRGEQEVDELSQNIITFLAKYLDSKIGAIYIFNEDKEKLILQGSYAFTKRKNINSEFKIGEGFIGQAAYENQVISLSDIPEDYIRINSALGDTSPRNIIEIPLSYKNKIIGVIELASYNEFDDKILDFINTIKESVAIGIASALAREKEKKLLNKTIEQAEELREQQEELRVSNEELEQQANALKASEEKLQAQQEELRVINEELEAKNNDIKLRSEKIKKQNEELELAKLRLEEKAKELEISGKYKSEFLANMSHELRTPLNSLLILSRDLADNKNKNLTEDQVESAEIIYNSGNDLLNLINDILDLSKIEAGKTEVFIEDVKIEDIIQNTENYFKLMINRKGLDFNINVEENVPEIIKSDSKKIQQIIKNLMSNAIKFTSQGSISLKFSIPKPEENIDLPGLKNNEILVISVTDTGIGIPENKQRDIFEAFQQADGSTSRKFGGTGLGLSISRELSKLLGGTLKLKSKVNEGSTFTVYLPLKSSIEKNEKIIVRKQKNIEPEKPVVKKNENPQKNMSIEEIRKIKSIPDDIDNITKDDRVILIIEDDNNFAKILLKQCHEKNFKALCSATGETGLILAEKYVPQAIILDIMLPGMNGWSVLNILKNNPKLRHIPVHIMSALEENTEALQKGAVGFLSKPVNKKDMNDVFKKIESFNKNSIKNLLLIEDDENAIVSIEKVIGGKDIKIHSANTGKKAVSLLKNHNFDCIVLDLGLPDINGFDLLDKLKEDKTIKLPPIIVYTGKDLTKEENERLSEYTDSIIIKGAKSEERLLDETALFLHRIVSEMPDREQNIIKNLYNKDEQFVDKKILLVDDDMRNVFALSKVLEDKGVDVIKAENGKKAIEKLNQNPDIDLVLMDIMMPVMDGYEAMKLIRSDLKYKDLPIIAVTAKAMKNDMKKCLDAGANDYISKPINIERLFSLLRVWLYK